MMKLKEKVNSLHDYLTQNISATTLIIIGGDRILNNIYDLDDILNPRNVTIFRIEENID